MPAYRKQIGTILLGSGGLIAPIIVVALIAAFALGAAEQRILIVFLINLIAVLGIGVYTGNSGILSFGHVAFMGLGAYMSAWLTMPTALKSATLPQLPGWLAAIQLDLLPATLIVIGVIAVIALLIGLPIARLGGSTAAIATLGLLVIIHGVLIGAKDFTRGSQSFFGVPRATTLWITLGWAIIAILAARWFRDSVPGLQLRAARDDEPAAAAMGVDVARRRLQAWVLSAVLVSISGILLGHFLGAFSPKKFYFIDTFALLAMLIVGGMTTVSGAVGGTVLITIVTEMLRRLEGGGELAGITLPSFFGLTQIGLSAMILLVMYRYRAGLFGLLEWDEAWLRRRAATATIGAGGGAGSDAGGEHGIDAGVAPAGSLRADAISKNFSGLQALQQVDLTLAAGEIVGLIGPNGSGKTTLLNILSGGLTASGGVVRIDDHDISRWPSHRIARRGIGRTFQNIRLFKDLSVLENITVGAIAHWPGTSHGSATRQARTLLHSLGLHEFARRPAGTLPYGAQRRLEIARALALRPRYLLLDEPAAGMNPAESTALLNDLRQIRERYGIGLLVVDHDLALIMRLCDRIVVLNEGRLIASGTPAEVQRDAAVIEAYIGRERAGVSSP